MLSFIKNFRRDEDGAVTVDWVVLTAAIVGLGIVVATGTLSGSISDAMDSASGTIDASAAV